MRKLIVIEEDGFVRDFIAAGAFDALEDAETYYVSGEITETAALERRANYLGSVAQPEARKAPYHHLRKVMLTAHRFRSPAQRKMVSMMRPVKRARMKLLALPGVRQAVIARTLGRLGLHPQLHPLIEELRPEIVIMPTGGVDTLTFDAARSARALGIPSLSIIYNWDNLTLKGVFPSESDYYAVPGQQAREIAWRVHRIEPERSLLLGSPYIDHHFRHEHGSTQSPFPFRYALFIGGAVKFDELTALKTLEAEIVRNGLDLKVVYRPHPNREPRDVPDLVNEAEFEHVVIDPQVRDRYLETFGAKSGSKPSLPALDYYPALLENAEFVISPLSTMMLEAAIFERQAIVIAYNDGIHVDSADVIFQYEYADGVEAIDGFELCREASDLPRAFTGIATGRIRNSRSLSEQIGYIIYHDERTYGERLTDLVSDLTGPAPAAGATRSPSSQRAR